MLLKSENLEILKWYNMKIAHFDMSILPESRSTQFPNSNNHLFLEHENLIIIEFYIIKTWK